MYSFKSVFAEEDIEKCLDEILNNTNITSTKIILRDQLRLSSPEYLYAIELKMKNRRVTEGKLFMATDVILTDGAFLKPEKDILLGFHPYLHWVTSASTLSGPLYWEYYSEDSSLFLHKWNLMVSSPCMHIS